MKFAAPAKKQGNNNGQSPYGHPGWAKKIIDMFDKTGITKKMSYRLRWRFAPDRNYYRHVEEGTTNPKTKTDDSPPKKKSQ